MTSRRTPSAPGEFEVAAAQLAGARRVLVTGLVAAPVELARESFEGTAGSIGFTTSVPQFEVTPGTVNDYFKVIPNNGTRVTGGILVGGDGASMFAG